MGQYSMTVGPGPMERLARYADGLRLLDSARSAFGAAGLQEAVHLTFEVERTAERERAWRKEVRRVGRKKGKKGGKKKQAPAGAGG